MSASHMHSLFVLIECVSLPLPRFVFTVTNTGNGKDNVMWVTVKVLILSVIIIIINICIVMSIFQKKYVHGLGLNSIQGLSVFKPFSKIIHVVFKGMQLTYELRCEKKVCRPFPQFYELRSARVFPP